MLTSLCSRTLFSATATASFTFFLCLYTHFSVTAECRLFKSKINNLTNISTAFWSVSSLTASESSETASEEIAEYIAKVKTAAVKATAARSEVRVNTCVSELVVFTFLFRVRKNLISLVYLLKLFLRFFIVRIKVRMVFLTHLSECLFYFIIRSTL